MVDTSQNQSPSPEPAAQPSAAPPEPTDREMASLLRHLDAQRQHVLGILEGLSEEQLRQPVLPSGWHCLGLVNHLAVSDEHYWFRCVVAGEPFDELPGQEDTWEVPPQESAADLVERYQEAIRRSNAIMVSSSLDAAPRQPDPDWEPWGIEFPDVRSVAMHVLTETSIHAGHLDAVRELIDGRQWVVL